MLNIIKKQSKTFLGSAFVVLTTTALSILVAFSPALISSIANAAAGTGYSIEVESQYISNLTLTLNGSAGSTSYKGQLDDQHVTVLTWGDGTTNVPADTFTLVSSGGTGNDKFFTADWGASHTYAATGTYTISVRVHHANANGNEGSDFATVTLIDVVIPPPPAPTENTAELCADTLDNDGDTLVDLNDPDCAEFVPVPPTPPTPTPENTAELCADTLDNDGDTLVDLNDPDCAAFVPVPPPAPAPTDVCPNIEGNQETLPDGMTLDGNGNCIAIVVTPPSPPAPTPENTAALCSDALDNDGDTLVDLSDPDCAAFVPAPNPTENTAELCSDALDNDGDTLVDLSDPDCAAFVPAPNPTENTAELCADTLDNDGDTLVDLNDPDCAAFVPVVAPTDLCPNIDGTQATIPSGMTLDGNGNCIEQQSSGGGGGGGSRRSSSSGSSANTSNIEVVNLAGEVLGESTTCGTTYLDSFIGIGKNNDSAAVIKLQQFLNEFAGENLPLTGVYGPLTMAAVNRFQVAHWQEILLPWVPYGLPTDHTPTGYVYKTTQRWINMSVCPELALAIPALP